MLLPYLWECIQNSHKKQQNCLNMSSKSFCVVASLLNTTPPFNLFLPFTHIDTALCLFCTCVRNNMQVSYRKRKLLISYWFSFTLPLNRKPNALKIVLLYHLCAWDNTHLARTREWMRERANRGVISWTIIRFANLILLERIAIAYCTHNWRASISIFGFHRRYNHVSMILYQHIS